MADNLTGSDPIVISGVSAVCAVGHSAPRAFTSIRAGLARIGVSDDLAIEDDRQHRLAPKCAAVDGVTTGHRRFLRLYRLALRAFCEAVGHARLNESALAAAAIKIALAEPERPGMDERVQHLLAPRLAAAIGVGDLSPRTQFVCAGHSGAYFGLEQGVREVAGGLVQRVIVGGVDSYLDELTLQWLYDLGRLKTDDNPKGFIPAEAASFVVIERESSALARGAGCYAKVASVATGFEDNGYYEDKPCNGEGLAAVLRDAIEAGGPSLPGALLICDLNGERHRAIEWGMAIPRCFQDAAPPELLWHPADALGDTGAASGALNLTFATLALARGHSGSHALAWGSSDDGERAAAVLARHDRGSMRRRESSWA